MSADGALRHTVEDADELPHSVPAATPAPVAAVTRPRRRRSLLRLLWWLQLVLLLALAALLAWELDRAELQSRLISQFAERLSYRIEPGPSAAIAYPSDGPFDRRLGYAYLPLMLERLNERGFTIDAQSRFSPDLLDYTGRGFFPPYREKLQAGLGINDCRGEPLYGFSYPQRAYPSFEAIPPLIVSTLLYIENRGLLDPARPHANPAVDWPRLAAAAWSQLQKTLHLQDSAAGGSTLATQIEKFRHSPDGLTLSAAEKLRQLVSASVRAYSGGPDTLPARRQAVLDYLNGVPLSAAPGHGEVHGLADGLRVWYAADFDQVNALLDSSRSPTATDAERGLALRQVLSLMIAQRRPSFYLAQGRNELTELTDAHLRLLVRDRLISARLGQAALAQRTRFRDWELDPTVQSIEPNKGINIARRRLSSLLGKPLYDLDRLDLSADSSLHGPLQEAVSAYLRRLSEPDYAREIGLFGERLLSADRTDQVSYSFTLYERSTDRFAVRVQTDSTDQPFDINEDSKLELGSTAKLRVLAHYLEVIAELHGRYAALPDDALRAVDVADDDVLTRWAIGHLYGRSQRDLPTMLEAALERRYSASPGERFFTGGGLHSFGNFRREDDTRRPTVREALRESINLPFVRLMRDLVRYSVYQAPGSSTGLMKDDRDPRRAEYLARFADREGTTFLLRFWRKYQGMDADARLAAFLDGQRPTPTRLAAVYRYLQPDADPDAFAAFLRARLPQARLGDAQLADLYRRYAPGAYSLPDHAYLARVHPLELWLLGHLARSPLASFDDAVAASREERQEVYGWLHRSRHRGARDSRVRIMVEVEAFLDIHRRWQRLGYPFGHLVPSLATALGSSGDRPAALAELVGIIQNDGVRLPTIRIDGLQIATGTPYETHLSRRGEGERVMHAEVAAALRGVLSQVVEGGTARRLHGSFRSADGTLLTVGGKTGTGDNRIETVAAGGRVISSRVMNRTATFVFLLGPHHFGTLTAYVPGRAAEGFRFTSALPVQVLRGMAPILLPHLGSDGGGSCGVPPEIAELPGALIVAH
jgi:membrane peptidoglycan carboxypeptidase